jgi:hypothetical protein
MGVALPMARSDFLIINARQIEAQKLEHRLSDLVNQAYQLTPEEIDLMWRTAPPRMPISAPEN